MPRTPFRRLTSGLFALWFALSGAMRGAAVACPQHAGVVASAAAEAGAAMSAMPVMSAPSGGAQHATVMHHGAGSSHGGTHSGGHCNCAGDCCGPSSASAPPSARSVPIALQRIETRRVPSIASRTIARVDYLLPFPTAPPRAANL